MSVSLVEANTATSPPLLSVRSLHVVLGHGWRASHALAGVDLSVSEGEIVGLVGETGSGKTTLARAIVGLAKPAKGEVIFDGVSVSRLRGRARRAHRRHGGTQYIFQDPLRSLDPDLTVGRIVSQGLDIRGGLSAEETKQRVVSALEQVGLDESLLSRTPGQISGGQRQRVSIARALATSPRLLICDEPVSASDASNRNYILRLLGQLRDSLQAAILIISHDLSSLAAIADRVIVLYRGKVVEDGPVEQVFNSPRHPYTALLIASTPSVKREGAMLARQLRKGRDSPPGPTGPGACVFATRCPFAIDELCAREPPLSQIGPGWWVACHRQQQWPALAQAHH